MTETQLRALLRDGYQLLRQGRYADAIALADRACADQPDNAHLLEFASEARLANGDPHAAAECIANAAAVASSPLPLLIKYASLLIQLRRRREATLVARHAQALAAADGNAWWRIGALYSGCQDVAAARDAYQHALTLLGDQPSLLYDLATMQFFGGEFDAAEVTVERLLQLAPNAGDALYLRATLRRQTGERQPSGRPAPPAGNHAIGAICQGRRPVRLGQGTGRSWATCTILRNIDRSSGMQAHDLAVRRDRRVCAYRCGAPSLCCGCPTHVAAGSRR